MRKVCLIIGALFFSYPVCAQFLDVGKIEKPTASHSVMFQGEVVEPQVKPQPKQEKTKAKAAPKKNAPVTNVSFFKPGDVKIMAVVNGDAISSSDVESYARLFMLNTGVPLNNKTKPMIINKVLQTAIDEKIKKQEAEKNQLVLSEKELNIAIDRYEAARKIPRGGMMKILKDKKINPEIFKQQMRTEILWARLIRRKMMSDSYITQREVEDAIARSQEDMKSPKYMVSEIVIPKEKAKNLEVLVDNIRRDGLFAMYAAQFSSAPSSANGGSLGWLKEGQLPASLEAKIKSMKVGQISQPIKHEDNFYILRLDDKYTPGKKTQKISFDDMKNVLENERLEGFASKYLQNLRQQSVIEFKG